MTDETIKQAALALIDRKTGSREWVDTTMVMQVVLGREPTVEDWHIPPPPEKITEENVGVGWKIHRVLKTLTQDNTIEFKGHYGWRRKLSE